MGILEALAGVLAVLEVVGVLPKIRGYFKPERRTVRAELFARLAKDVIGLVQLQKGLSPVKAAVASEAVDMLVRQLVREGVKKANARPMAERLLAGAAVERSG